MFSKGELEKLPLPKGWPTYVKSAIVHTISLASLCLSSARGWTKNAINPQARIQTELEKQQNEINLLKLEISIKDARIQRIDPRHRRTE